MELSSLSQKGIIDKLADHLMELKRLSLSSGAVSLIAEMIIVLVNDLPTVPVSHDKLKFLIRQMNTAKIIALKEITRLEGDDKSVLEAVKAAFTNTIKALEARLP